MVDDNTAIRVEHVSKTFKLPHERQSSIKGALINTFKGGKRTYEKQQVLNDISFEVKKGEFFGIVGRNGSGKSTLLKILAGIYSPTKGAIHTSGKLTPFIELGVGFNMELTGRENVYLNGALLGFNRTEMDAMYDDIVSFAEIERFMDQKLKNYSSGMQVRLAFSIAIRAQSDILILDEVLAVGDEAFQQKCIDVFEQYKASNRTVVLVTHDMEQVRRFCSRAMLINNGDVLAIGDPNNVARKYSELNIQKLNTADSVDNSAIDIRLINDQGKTSHTYGVNETVTIQLSWPLDLKGVKNIGLGVMKNSGELMFGVNTIGKGVQLKDNQLSSSIKLDLGPGKYHIIAGLFGDSRNATIDFRENGPEFIVKGNDKNDEEGLVRLKNEWH